MSIQHDDGGIGRVAHPLTLEDAIKGIDSREDIIRALKRDRADLAAALTEIVGEWNGACGDYTVSKVEESMDSARALLARLEKGDKP